MDHLLDPRELFRMLRHRKWYSILPAALVIVATIALLLVLPKMYTSEATLLIERQEVPEDLVQPLQDDVIERRLEVLTWRVLSQDYLARLAERLDLFAEERSEMSPSAIAGRVRSRIETEMLFTPISEERGNPVRSSIAFQVRYSDGDPVKAQRAASEIVSALLSANLNDRKAIADQAAAFFSNEREALDRQIATVEERFTEFKIENQELLPEEIAFKRQQLSSIEQQMRTLDANRRAMEERASFLETQIALTNEFDVSAQQRGGDTPESRLELLLAELTTAQARYNANHPDVVRLRREVQALQSVVGNRSGTSPLADKEASLTAELAALQQRYTDSHPDVQRVQRELDVVRQNRAAAGDAAAGALRNPAYIQLRAQLNSVEADINVIEQQRADLEEKRRSLQTQLVRAPAVEREYNRFQRELENVVAARNALADKEASTKLSGSLETAAVAQQLTLMGPPTLPGAPSSPSVPLILGAGLMTAVASGGVSAALAELLDRSVRSSKELARILGDQPLVSVPVIWSPKDVRRVWLRRAAGIAAVVACFAGALFWVHTAMVPLEVLGLQAQSWIEEVVPGGETSSETP